MNTFRLCLLSACVLYVLHPFSTLASPIGVVPVNAVWKYRADGSDLGTAWRAPAFDDSTWLSGAAQLGYGDNDEATFVVTPAERPATVYFRKSVLIPSGVTSGTISLLRDDGAVVYINGVEVMRSNMPEGPVAYNTMALSAVGGGEETDVYVSGTVPAGVLVPGTNVIAVEIHQNSLLSSDMSFALGLIVEFGPPPPVVLVQAVVPETREVSPLTDVPIVPAVFRITRSGTNGPLAVSFRMSGTASNGVDYEFVPGEVVIEAGRQSADVYIVAQDDELVEGPESVVLTLLTGGCLPCYTVGSPIAATVTILDNEPFNRPPEVAIFQPVDGATFQAPTSIWLQATAEDAEDSEPLSVTFFRGTNRIGEATFHPTLCPQNCPYYALMWSNVPPGMHTLTARATDSAGATATSAPVRITVLGTNQPPEQTVVNVVAVDSQASEPGILTVVDAGRFAITRRGNLNVAIPVHFTLTGTAANGVDYRFISNSVVIPAGATQALVNVVALPDDLIEGTETVVLALEPVMCVAIFPPPPECYRTEVGVATVFINDGPFSTNRPPEVVINTPASGTVFASPASIYIEAATRDPDGYVSRVDFFANEQKIGEARIEFIQPPPPGETMTFDMTWTNPPPGQYVLRAQAFDDDGVTGWSPPVGITVLGTNQPPHTNELVIRFEPASLPGGSRLISNWVEHGFSFRTPDRMGHTANGASTNLPSNGTAYLQFGGNQSPLTIRHLGGDAFRLVGVDLAEYSRVFPVPKDITFIGHRRDGAVVSAIMRIDGVIDGDGPAADFQSFTFGPEFSGLWLVEVSPPPYSLDNVRVVLSSTNPPPPPPSNQPPTVVIVTPVNGAGFPAGTNVFLGANAFTTSGVQRVDFYAGSTFLGQASGPLPGLLGAWGLTWQDVPAGSHALRAVATDTFGRRGTSAPVNITVFGTIGPVVRVFATDSNAFEMSLSIVNTGRFTFTRSGSLSNALPVYFTLSGTALNGIDYLQVSNRIVIPPGASNAHLLITARDDLAVEPTETVVLNLLSPPTSPDSIPYIVGAPSQATVLIYDNDTNSPPPAATNLIAAGSVWKYSDLGVDLGTDWRAPAYNDAAWASGPAQLGFGDGDEATVINAGPLTNRIITAYFRRTFTVSDPGAISNLTVRLLRDDGGVVYLNGVEVFRSNMPQGAVSYSTLAIAAAEEPGDFHSAAVDASLLVPGENVVAVEIHQNAIASSDLSFDLQLIGASAPPPVERTVVTVFASDAQASEPDVTTSINPGQFTFRRTGNLGFPIPVLFSLSGSAVNGVDYAFVSNRVIIPAGATQAVVTFVPRMDALVEGMETVIATVQPVICIDDFPPLPACYLVGSPGQATAFIHDSVGGTNNQPPTATMVMPGNGATFGAPANILLGAETTDDGPVQRVEFQTNGVFLGNAVGPLNTPAGTWLLMWSNVPPGSYAVRAVAVDTLGAKGTSAPVHVTVTNDPGGGAVTLVSTGAVWKYHDLGADLGTSWTLPAFDDAGWNSGPAQLGYGDSDEATVVGFGPDPTQKYITTYFRRAFEVSDPSPFNSLQLRLLYDDGGVVYLNGTEVLRVNLPPGPIGYNTFASSVSLENAIAEATISSAALVPGRNVLAVEIHQVNPVSSDLSFDLSLIGSGESPPGLPPSVELVAPAEGATFAGPTNIMVAARASDPDGNHTLRLIEFFAGATRIGVRTNFPGAEPVFPVTINWMNVQPGAYSLTAVATDSDGAKGTSAPVHITVTGPQVPTTNREVHVVAVYSGNVNGGSSPNHERGDASVTVDRPGKGVVLVLSAYEPVYWHVTVAPGTTLESVLLFGYYDQAVDGVPAGVPVVEMTYEGSPSSYFYFSYDINAGSFLGSVQRLCGITGQGVTSFHGTYTAPHPTPFVVNSVQTDPRLQCDYPQPVDPSQLPNLNFSLSFNNGYDGQVLWQDYSLAGPFQSAARLLPTYRVVTNGSANFFYGADQHHIWRVDAGNGSVADLHLPPELPELSWPMGITYDSLRQRVLVASLGGEGHLYAYAPASSLWTLVSTLDNRDVDSLAYHAADDSYYAVTVTHGDYGPPRLLRLGTNGELLGEFPLPQQPFGIGFGAFRSELVSVGEYLVLLLETDNYVPQGARPEARIYLIDPRSGEVWLTFRRVGNTENRAPTVRITFPTEGAQLPPGSTTLLSAEALDPDGLVQTVEFFANGASLGLAARADNFPGAFHLNWTPAAGQYTLRAQARDGLGATAWSIPVTVGVGSNVPPSTNFTFRLAFNNREGDAGVIFRNYAVDGPLDRGRLLPALRVVPDASGQWYYGAEQHQVWRVDVVSGEVQFMQIPAPLPELSWPIGSAFDASRNRVLVATLGGEGHLYAYSTASNQWSLVNDLNNHDFDSIVHHAADDSIYGFEGGYGGMPRLVRMDASGNYLGEIPVPPQAGGISGHSSATELVSVGEYLVLLVEPNSYPSDQFIPAARIYLIDPRTGQVRLTYSRAGAFDSDSDGVPDEEDQCPGSALDAPVDAHGCSANQRDADNDGVVDGQDECLNTEAGAIVNSSGCSIAQIAPCEGPWRNHNDYVEAVETAAEAFQKAGLISFDQRQEIVAAARRSDCGFRNPTLTVPLQCTDEIRTNGCQLVLEGEGSITCVVECSTDLVRWTPLSTNVLSGATISIQDPDARTAPRRFYRLRPDSVAPSQLKAP